MSDSSNGEKKTVSERLMNLAKKIPGLRTHLKREELRDQNKLLRDYTAGKFDQLKEHLDVVKQALLDQMKLSYLDDFDRLGQKIDKLRDQQKHAAYGFTGAFDPNRMTEENLEKLYAADLDILEKVEALLNTCSPLCRSDIDEAGAKAALNTIRIELNELEKRIEQRRDSVKNLGL